MSARPLSAHPLNRLGIALLFAALVCWIGFHLLPIDHYMRGWELWKIIWLVLTSGSPPDWITMIFISAFLTIAILVATSPFVTILLRSSKACRWLAIGVSGAALLSVGSIILIAHAHPRAYELLLAAMALNFVGLICLRAPRLETAPESP